MRRVFCVAVAFFIIAISTCAAAEEIGIVKSVDVKKQTITWMQDGETVESFAVPKGLQIQFRKADEGKGHVDIPIRLDELKPGDCIAITIPLMQDPKKKALVAGEITGILKLESDPRKKK